MMEDRGVEDLVGNTTVIAVNVAEQGDRMEGGAGGDLLRPDNTVNRTNSNRSANETKEIIIKGKKLGHRRVKDGEVTFKKFETTQLMGSIQLGIQQSVGNLACQEDRDLLHADFYTEDTVVFSRDGSLQKTPAHNYSKFKFRTYAPLAYRTFRNIFEIERDKFLVSLCAEPMIELSNPGASGSIFYVTQDDEFICKTVSHKESQFMQEILPAYYLNLHQNFRTLLPKFFGFYCYSCNTKNVRIIVMKNLIPRDLEMHHKFDLKGSTYNRKASRKERSKAVPTFKDLDFLQMYPEGIFLQPELYDSLMDTLERDCRALESLKIMDYSFLIGIHNVDQAGNKKPLLSQMNETLEKDGSSGRENGSDGRDYSGDKRHPMLERIGSFRQRQRLIAHSTALESITAEMDDATIGDLTDERDTIDRVNTWGGIPAKNHKGENLILFIGIIDILQSFGMAKKLEHTWKSLIHDGDTVSVHRPSFYAARFKTFLEDRVFQKMPSNLKAGLSFRKSQVAYKRAASKESPDTVQRTKSQSGVTVITVGDQSDTTAILPSVLRDKPRLSTNTTPARPQMLTHSKPDVLRDVKGASCTSSPIGGVTSSDERVQIYVPSPQSTPYSTISKHPVDSHRSITFLSYKGGVDTSGDISVSQMDSPESSIQEFGTMNSFMSEQEEVVSNYRRENDMFVLRSQNNENERFVLRSENDEVTDTEEDMVVPRQEEVTVSTTKDEIQLSNYLSVNQNPVISSGKQDDSLSSHEEEQDKEPVSLSGIVIQIDQRT